MHAANWPAAPLMNGCRKCASFWGVGATGRARRRSLFTGRLRHRHAAGDLYLNGLSAMGADINVEGGYVNHAAALKGARVDFPLSRSVRPMCCDGRQPRQRRNRDYNAATEPEVVDVGRCLQAMGAQIDGLGTRSLTVQGVDTLSGAEHVVTRDRIEAGAFALAVAATAGDVTLTGIDETVLGALAPAMRLAGADLTDTAHGLHVKGPQTRPQATPITTEPYPGFATDLQAPFMGLMCCADGVSRIRETIFENRFMHVQNWRGWAPIFLGR